MTLYILRHEARGSDQTFNSRLTPDGKAAAEGKLAATLQQLGIQTVFCSPFVRTIETIAPYCTRNGHEIRLEWGLCEFLASRQHAALENPAPHPPEVFGCKIAESSSVVPPESLRYPERSRHLIARVRAFITSLLRMDVPKPVLVCSHMHVCNTILQIVNSDHPLNFHFHQGSVIGVDLEKLSAALSENK
ncbi:hypothetical protein DIPPA_15605 [Diplonema papillatum]|nr:hypothetical protein DIPPA_15605 [Diplonema papillatum]